MGNFDHLPKDSDGQPCRYTNYYRCETCDENWQDQWSCACDDKCPSCGLSISPYTYTIEGEEPERPETGTPEYGAWLKQPGNLDIVLREVRARMLPDGIERIKSIMDRSGD